MSYDRKCKGMEGNMWIREERGSGKEEKSQGAGQATARRVGVTFLQ